MKEFHAIRKFLSSRPRGNSQSERMENFYKHQATYYDSFRTRLLTQRESIYSNIGVPVQGKWLEVGGGTGSNLEYLAEELKKLHSVTIFDLCPSLLNVARDRIKKNNWENVHVHMGNALKLPFPDQSFDRVVFSYSLSMMKDWELAVHEAHRVLKTGGRIGVVDFFVSDEKLWDDFKIHSWWTRNFWPKWFAIDHVFIKKSQAEFLLQTFRTVKVFEGKHAIPYLSFLGKVPRYTFIGERLK